MFVELTAGYLLEYAATNAISCRPTCERRREVGPPTDRLCVCLAVCGNAHMGLEQQRLTVVEIGS